jgi:hypothetical protein
MYDSDRGIEELLQRLSGEKLAVEWLAEQMRGFVDLYPEWEDAVGRLASFLARQSDD